jgi:maltose alpha-D-glucosyltransferase/alpha-amylase
VRLERALERWRDHSTQTFLAAYRGITGIDTLWPKQAEIGGRLLEFFTLEKLLYEIGYEVTNRPDWVHAPLAAACRILFPPRST